MENFMDNVAGTEKRCRSAAWLKSMYWYMCMEGAPRKEPIFTKLRVSKHCCTGVRREYSYLIICSPQEQQL